MDIPVSVMPFPFAQPFVLWRWVKLRRYARNLVKNAKRLREADMDFFGPRFAERILACADVDRCDDPMQRRLSTGNGTITRRHITRPT